MSSDSGGTQIRKNIKVSPASPVKAPPPKRKKSVACPPSLPELPDNSDTEDHVMYTPFLKQNYVRSYPENSTGNIFPVYIQSTKDDVKFGNKSPIYLNNIFSRSIKGVKELKRVNAQKYAVIFDSAKSANALLRDSSFLNVNELKAFIPASTSESIGVIKFVPTDLSNKVLFDKLSSRQDILAVRRFMKKTHEGLIPLTTISVTFASNILPDHVNFDLCQLRVEPYIRPIVQCYKCMAFGHTTKYCRHNVVCSICSQAHYYKECTNSDNPLCINCKGNHIAVSRDCPVKQQKIIENKEKIVNKLSIKNNFPALNKSYAVVSSTTLPKKDNKTLIGEIVNNTQILSSLVMTLTTLLSKENTLPINSSTIKELLIKNIKL
ncbi:uncharacterized protein [Epargyreus clarus]|uniref:uncharacterized protein n=1 Tax=Epargyreus clarus TaxID=520877 RepID=UPI003C2E3D7B